MIEWDDNKPGISWDSPGIQWDEPSKGITLSTQPDQIARNPEQVSQDWSKLSPVEKAGSVVGAVPETFSYLTGLVPSMVAGVTGKVATAGSDLAQGKSWDEAMAHGKEAQTSWGGALSFDALQPQTTAGKYAANAIDKFFDVAIKGIGAVGGAIANSLFNQPELQSQLKGRIKHYLDQGMLPPDAIKMATQDTVDTLPESQSYRVGSDIAQTAAEIQMTYAGAKGLLKLNRPPSAKPAVDNTVAKAAEMLKEKPPEQAPPPAAPTPPPLPDLLPEYKELLKQQAPELPPASYGKTTPVGQALAQERAANPPLPEIRETLDQTPLLPETKIAQETGPGERPLPTINQNMAPGGEDLLHVRPDNWPEPPRRTTETQIPPVDMPDKFSLVPKEEDIKSSLSDAIDRQYAQIMQAEEFRKEWGAKNDTILQQHENATFDKLYGDLGKLQEKEGASYPPPAPEPTPKVTPQFRKAGWYKKQGGAMHPDLIGVGKVKEMLDKLGDWETFKKFKGTFLQSKLSQAMADSRDPKSREMLVWMKPDDFLRMAKKRPKEWLGGMAEEKRGSIRKGISSEEGLKDIPFLWIENHEGSSSVAKVYGHEGRHRMDVFKEQGVDMVPVRIRDATNRWGENGNPYTHLFSEDGLNVQKFPEPIFNSYPGAKDTLQKMGKATKQSGALLSPQDMKDALQVIKNKLGFSKKIEDASKTSLQPNAVADKQAMVGKKIFGEDELIQALPKEKSGAEIKQMLSQEPDIKGSWWLITTQELKGLIKGSKSFDEVINVLKNANKKTDIKNRMFFRPLDTMWNDLFRSKEGETLSKLLIQEQLARKTLTGDQLKSLGLSDKAIKVHDQMRQFYEEGFQRMNEKLLELGQKPVTPEEAYVAAFHHGSWQTPVYTKDGKLAFYVAATSKGRAKAALKYLSDNEPEVDLTKSKIDFAPQRYSNVEEGYKFTYQSMIQLLGDDHPLTPRLKELYEEFYRLKGEWVHGQPLHFIPKGNIRGFVGDRAWMDSRADAREFSQSQMQYLRNMEHWTNMQDAMAKIKEVLADKDLQKTHGNTLAMMEEMTRTFLGMGESKSFRALENWFSQNLGELFDHKFARMITLNQSAKIPTDVRSMATGLGAYKSFFYHWTLGFGSGIMAQMSFIQPVYMLPNMVYAMTKEHLVANPFTAVAKGTGHAAGALLYHYSSMMDNIAESSKFAKDLGNFGKAAADHWFKSDTWLKDATKYAEANAVANINPVSDIADIGRPDVVRAGERMSGWSISEPERMARTATFMSMAHYFKDAGLEQEAAFRKAEAYTNMVMGDYTMQGRAPIFNRMGLIGSGMNTLKTFTIHQLNLMHLFAKEMFKSGNFAPFFSLMALNIALGGVFGIIGVDAAHKFWEWLKEPKDLPGGYGKIAPISPDLFPGAYNFNIKAELAKHLPDWAQWGLVSKVTGLDWGSHLGMNNILDPSMRNLFPFMTMDFDDRIMANLINVLIHQDQQSLDTAKISLAPNSLRNFAEAHSPTYDKQLPNGQFSIAPRNNPTYEVYRRSPEEQKTFGMPFIGMPSLKERIGREATYRTNEIKGEQENALRFYSDKFRRALLNNNVDGMVDSANAYGKISKNDMSGLFNSITPDEIARFAPLEARLAMQASNPRIALLLRELRALRGQ